MSVIHDVIVVGSGPAGLSAAVYASRAGLDTVVIPSQDIGGLLTTTEHIDNYLGLYGSSGEEMAENFVEHAKKFGAVIHEGQTVVSIVKDANIYRVESDFGETFLSKTVIFASGSKPKEMGVEGEEAGGVSYCATCDGIFFENQDVVVVGGGETAAEDALYMSKVAKSVTVLVRGDKWRATQPAVDKLKEQGNVNIVMETSITQIVSTDDVVSSVETISLDGVKNTIEAAGVFVAIGQVPQSHIAHDSGLASIYDNGFIRNSQSDGFFIAGDVADPDYRQVAVAVGSGAIAGIDATKFVLGS